MGQTLERFSSVTEEKKNTEIDRIVDQIYKKYLEEPEVKPQPSNQTEGNIKSNEASEKKAPEENKENKKSNEASEKKAPSNGTSEKKAPEENKENKKSNEASEYKAKFYRAVCEIVGELNKKFGNTQFKVPSIENLNKAFEKHRDPTKPVTKEEFQSMLQDILKTESVFPGFGAKDALVYIFTAPAAAVLAKQRFFPRAIPNDVLIAGVTSATVFALAKLNKI